MAFVGYTWMESSCLAGSCDITLLLLAHRMCGKQDTARFVSNALTECLHTLKLLPRQVFEFRVSLALNMKSFFRDNNTGVKEGEKDTCDNEGRAGTDNCEPQRFCKYA